MAPDLDWFEPGPTAADHCSVVDSAAQSTVLSVRIADAGCCSLNLVGPIIRRYFIYLRSLEIYWQISRL